MKYLIGAVVVLGIIAILKISNNSNKNNINNNDISNNSKDILQKGEPKTEYRKISQEEAKNRLDSEKEIILLDVRTFQENREEHIPNSMLIPLNVIENEIESKVPNKESKLFVYCRSGSRSRSASQILINMGYKSVYDIGGIMDWKYETESGK